VAKQRTAHTEGCGEVAALENIALAMEGNQVIARCRGERVGRLMVPEIRFQWCENTVVPMAGISGVGTDKRFRQRGVARRMMHQAVSFSREEGYACGGVSTGAGNVARRLYTSAGYVCVFALQDFERKASSRRVDVPQHVQVRGYEAGDERSIVQMRRRSHGAYSGCREQDENRWLQMRRETLGTDSQSVLVAVQEGEPVGYASYFQHWFNLACDIFVGECAQRCQVGRALLRMLEQSLLDVKCTQAQFSVTDDEPFVRRLLEGEHYRAGLTRVFHVNILDLGRLLSHLRVALEARVASSRLAGWRGVLRVETETDRGTLVLGPGPVGDEARISASHTTLTRVLCGRVSGWEAYLRGELDIAPGPNTDPRALLETLFPRVPCCHPIDDWW